MSSTDGIAPTVDRLDVFQISKRIRHLSDEGMNRREIEKDLKEQIANIPHMDTASSGAISRHMIRAAFKRASPLNEKHAERLQAIQEDQRQDARKPKFQGMSKASQRRTWLRRMVEVGSMPVGARGWPTFHQGPDKLVAEGLAELSSKARGMRSTLAVLTITDKGRQHLERLDARAQKRRKKFETTPDGPAI